MPTSYFGEFDRRLFIAILVTLWYCIACEKGGGARNGREKIIDGSLALNGKTRIVTIPAAEAPRDGKLRVAAYCRVSSDSADQLNSFAAQNA